MFADPIPVVGDPTPVRAATNRIRAVVAVAHEVRRSSCRRCANPILPRAGPLDREALPETIANDPGLVAHPRAVPLVLAIAVAPGHVHARVIRVRVVRLAPDRGRGHELGQMPITRHGANLRSELVPPAYEGLISVRRPVAIAIVHLLAIRNVQTEVVIDQLVAIRNGRHEKLDRPVERKGGHRAGETTNNRSFAIKGVRPVTVLTVLWNQQRPTAVVHP